MPQEPQQELMGFLQLNGGKTGSWNTADHAKFLKIYNTWKGVPELIFEKTVQEMKCKRIIKSTKFQYVSICFIESLTWFQFTDKSSQEIMAHMKWFEDYESLIESHKNEVRKWDAGKRKERAMNYQMTIEGQKSKLEDEKKRKEHLKTIRLLERQRARENVSNWKV